MKAIVGLGIGLGFAGMAIVVGAIALGPADKEFEPNYGVAWGLGVWLLGVIVAVAAYFAIWQKKSEQASKKRDEWLGQWDRLLEGMTESEVRSTIGAPTKVEPLIAMTGEAAAQWTYGTWPFKGIVRFIMGRLVGLQKPR